MSGHLLAISIGPVQEFIAAARRMGDLWYGSQLLSEVSGAVARTVQAQGGSLIFPHPDALLASDGNSYDSIANVILAELPLASDPRKVAQEAKEAAKALFRQKADEALQALHAFLRNDIWESQVDDVVECFAAWTLRTTDYCKDRNRVMYLLAARKATREFNAAKGFAGVPKSTLDGQRETVQKTGATQVSRLRLNGKEFLDCVGVVKRFQSKENGFPSVATVAASDWLARVRAHSIADWNALENWHQQLWRLGVISKVPREQLIAVNYWEFEASPLYESRQQQLKDDATELGKLAEASSLLNQIAERVRILTKKKEIGKLDSYYVLILADGDNMGKALDACDDPDEHRDFSRRLARFAKQMPEQLAQVGSICIYSGGDDVMAFAPLRKALVASKAIQTSFNHCMEGMQVPPTISVGVAIVHIQEPLEMVRKFAQDAEKRAKGKSTERNGLAVALHTRGIDTTTTRGSWATDFDRTLEEWISDYLEERLPGNIPYATRRELLDLKDWNNAALVKEALPLRLKKNWVHKQINLKPQDRKSIRIDATTSWDALEQLLSELRIARFIAMGVEE